MIAYSVHRESFPLLKEFLGTSQSKLKTLTIFTSCRSLSVWTSLLRSAARLPFFRFLEEVTLSTYTNIGDGLGSSDGSESIHSVSLGAILVWLPPSVERLSILGASRSCLAAIVEAFECGAFSEIRWLRLGQRKRFTLELQQWGNADVVGINAGRLADLFSLGLGAKLEVLDFGDLVDEDLSMFVRTILLSDKKGLCLPVLKTLKCSPFHTFSIYEDLRTTEHVANHFWLNFTRALLKGSFPRLTDIEVVWKEKEEIGWEHGSGETSKNWGELLRGGRSFNFRGLNASRDSEVDHILYGIAESILPSPLPNLQQLSLPGATDEIMIALAQAVQSQRLRTVEKIYIHLEGCSALSYVLLGSAFTSEHLPNLTILGIGKQQWPKDEDSCLWSKFVQGIEPAILAKLVGLKVEWERGGSWALFQTLLDRAVKMPHVRHLSLDGHISSKDLQVFSACMQAETFPLLTHFTLDQRERVYKIRKVRT